MTQYLPPNLLSLFAARDPIPFLPPPDKLTWEKKTDGYSGVAHLIARFEDPVDTPPPKKVETRDERLERKRREKAEQIQYKLEQEIALWDPHNDPNATTDPYKTLFVARINYDTSESKLRREFEIYGPIKKIRMVQNINNNKPRGYAFVEYEHERDMHSAYKNADGRKMDNRRVLVDVERARTVKGWLSRRLGGGLGGTRRGGPDVNIKHSGREDDRKRGVDDTERDTERIQSRDRSRDKSRKRSRSREKEREREPRRRRSRSRDRKPRRRSPRDRVPAAEVVLDDEPAAGGDNARARRHRSRSPRDKDRDNKDRDNKDRDNKDRDNKDKDRDNKDRDRERKHRRSRSRERRHRRERERGERGLKVEGGTDGDAPVKIKQEPDDDYPDYSAGGGPPVYNNIPLKDEDGKTKNGTKFEDEDEQQRTKEIDY